MTTSFLQTDLLQECYGCRACEKICPKSAISIKPNSEGFIYPILDLDKCVDCGMCHNVCPYDNPPIEHSPIKAFAFQYHNNIKLLKSSSGGAFPAMADYILSKGGYVCGCIYNNNKEAIHVVSNHSDVVALMSGSKYVQSDLLNVYPEIKKLLDGRQLVLFSGTPCQVAGLLNYLKKTYDNLFTVDLICHGVPSPLLLKRYLDSYKNEVVDLQFRDKMRNGWCSQGSIKIKYGSKKYKIKRISPYNDSYYYYYYLRNSVSRISCYSCAFATRHRISDITIGDYWNIQDIIPELNKAKGVSAVLANTNKGVSLIDKIKNDAILYETSIDDIVKGNGNLQKPCEMPIQRKYIYGKINELGFSKTARQECRFDYVLPLFRKLIPKSIKRTIKKLIYKN